MTTVEMSQKYDVHLNQINPWKPELLECVAEIFDHKKSSPPAVDVKTLQAKIGPLASDGE